MHDIDQKVKQVDLQQSQVAPQKSSIMMIGGDVDSIRNELKQEAILEVQGHKNTKPDDRKNGKILLRLTGQSNLRSSKMIRSKQECRLKGSNLPRQNQLLANLNLHLNSSAQKSQNYSPQNTIWDFKAQKLPSIGHTNFKLLLLKLQLIKLEEIFLAEICIIDADLRTSFNPVVIYTFTEVIDNRERII